jgi:hypothetical protein
LGRSELVNSKQPKQERKEKEEEREQRPTTRERTKQLESYDDE